MHDEFLCVLSHPPPPLPPCSARGFAGQTRRPPASESPPRSASPTVALSNCAELVPVDHCVSGVRVRVGCMLVCGVVHQWRCVPAWVPLFPSAPGDLGGFPVTVKQTNIMISVCGSLPRIQSTSSSRASPSNPRLGALAGGSTTNLNAPLTLLQKYNEFTYPAHQCYLCFGCILAVYCVGSLAAAPPLAGLLYGLTMMAAAGDSGFTASICYTINKTSR